VRRGLRILFTSQNLTLAAGFILIAADIICLFLSDKVVTGSWQGTLDAFGVGFIIAGIVDVLAISALNQRTQADDQRLRETTNWPSRCCVAVLSPRTSAPPGTSSIAPEARPTRNYASSYWT
jgi:hypothetical protein